jgi:hypothetical protein
MPITLSNPKYDVGEVHKALESDSREVCNRHKKSSTSGGQWEVLFSYTRSSSGRLAMARLSQAGVREDVQGWLEIPELLAWGTLRRQLARGGLFDTARISSQYFLSVCTAYALIVMGACHYAHRSGPLIAQGAAAAVAAIQAAAFASCCATWMANSSRLSPFGLREELHMERYPGDRFPCFSGQGGGHMTAP